MKIAVRFISGMLLLGILCVPVFAGDFTYPVLRQRGHTIESFVPAGWHIIRKVIGDLHGDKLPDAAVVIQYQTDINGVSKENSSGKEAHHPRIFFVIFKLADGDYKLSVQSNDLILCEDEGNQPDPFGENGSMSISHGTIMLGFEYIGFSFRLFCFCQFRFQRNAWYLIGLTEDSWELNDERTAEEYDFNLLTGKMKISQGVLSSSLKQFIDVRKARWVVPGKRNVRLPEFRKWYDNEWDKIRR